MSTVAKDPVPPTDPGLSENLATLESHILAEESRYPGATGTFTWILSALTLSAKIIANKIRRARIEDVLGAIGTVNVTGDEQQKLDVIANETLMWALGNRAGVAVLASEENDQPIILRTKEDRPYCVLFDPLDGSSNLDACVSVGTIFSILRHDTEADPIEKSLLQPGVKQVAAGYILYGSSCVFVLTTGHGVNLFVLHPSVGAFILAQENLRIPKAAPVTRSTRPTGPNSPPATRSTSTGCTPRAIRAGTSAPWSPTSTASWCRGGCSSIRPRRRTRPESCA